MQTDQPELEPRIANRYLTVMKANPVATRERKAAIGKLKSNCAEIVTRVQTLCDRVDAFCADEISEENGRVGVYCEWCDAPLSAPDKPCPHCTPSDEPQYDKVDYPISATLESIELESSLLAQGATKPKARYRFHTATSIKGLVESANPAIPEIAKKAAWDSAAFRDKVGSVSVHQWSPEHKNFLAVIVCESTDLACRVADAMNAAECANADSQGVF